MLKPAPRFGFVNRFSGQLGDDGMAAADHWSAMSGARGPDAAIRPAGFATLPDSGGVALASTPHPGVLAQAAPAADPLLASPFTAGNIVVYRIGDGAAALSGAATAVFLDEYTTAGAFVQSIALPTLDSGSNQILTASGTSTAEGLLNRSEDGRYLLLTGYDAGLGTASVSGTSSATVNRVIGRVDASGNVDTSTAITAFTGASPRSAVSTDGANYWATGGATGVVYGTIGSSTTTIVANTQTGPATAVNLRSIDIFGDQLYVSAQTGSLRIGAVGTGEPTTTGQVIAPLPGVPLQTNTPATNTSPYQFFFADLTAAVGGVDTLYLTDDRGAASGGGLYKFSLVGGSWVLNGLAANSLRGLTGSVSGTTVTFYATTSATSANAIVSIVDSGGYNAAFSSTTYTTVFTAAANTVLRGIDFAPQAAAGNPGTLSIAGASAAEGDTSTTPISFTVSRTGGSSGAVSATWTVTFGGSADSGDFQAGQSFTGTVNFADSDTSETIVLNVQGDDLVEGDETFTITLSLPTGGATLGTAAATGTITNDDASGTLSIGDVTLAEGNSGTTAFTFIVTRSGGDDGTVGATWTLTAPGGTGLADSGDFDPGQLGTGSVSFLDGDTSETITILVAGDVVFEGDETFLVTLSAPTGGAALGNANGTGTITNDDPAPAGTISIADLSQAENAFPSGDFTFSLSRTGGSNGAVSVDYAITFGAGAGNADANDFAVGQVFTGTVNFADGETAQTLNLSVLDDATFEPDENFTVTLSNATGGAGIGDGMATGTILNDDVAPVAGSVSIADATIVEGNSGTSILILTLTRSGGTAAFDVNFATSNGGNPLNASATAGSDYLAASGTVNFAPGQNTQTIQVTINGDLTPELDEEFTVTLSSPTVGATIGDGSAIATIETDDAQPASTRIFDEDFTGFTAGGFAPNPTATQVDSDIWRVVGLSDIPNPAYGFTATTGDFARGTIGSNDPTTAGVYSPTSNPALVVQPTAAELETNGFIEARIENVSGSTATGFDIAFDWSYRNSGDRASSLTFSYSTDGTNFITVADAALSTPATAGAATNIFALQNELVSLTGLSVAAGQFVYLRWTHVSSAGGGNRDEVGIDNVIVDATGGASGPLVSVGDVSVNEAAGTMTFTVTRANAAAGAFTVDYATANGTALAGSDYGSTSGTLSFADNQVSATVTVTINDEAVAELDETVLLNLSGATGATIADGQGVGTIVNDDGAPIQVSINDVSIVEGNAGTSLLIFTVTRTGGSGAFDVAFATADNSATAGSDYDAQSGTLNFAAGQNSQTVQVTINGDTLAESNETFFVNLSNPTNNAVIADGQGVGTIINDEPTFIHDIQGTAYFSPILASDGISAFNTASTTVVTVRAIVTAVDNVGNRQGYYLAEEVTDWDGNSFTSEGIFVMTRNDAGVGAVVSGVAVGDLVQLSANVMEYQAFSTMPRTVLVNPTGLSVISSGNSLTPLTVALTNMPNAVLTTVTPNYTDSSDGAGDTFDASVYALSYYETVEGMLVTIPNMVVADGFVSTSGGDPFLQAYSLDSANPEQINSRGGYTIAGDPPNSPPTTAGTGDDTVNGGRHLHDGDTNPDIVELDFTDFATPAPAGLLENATMGDQLGDVTGIIDFDFTDRKLFVTAMEPGGFVDGGNPVQETTGLGGDDRSLTVATFNVENLDPGDGAARFTALANAIADNLNAPDIICIEEMQDNNGATATGGADASTTWTMLVNALNAATGKVYQWVDQDPVAGAEGGEPGGNIRVGFLYDTGRVQLGDLGANATLAERRQYTDRIGDGVRDAGDLIAFDDSMLGAEINTADWTTTRKSLLGEFTFNGNKVYVTANHWPSKGGSGEFWQFNQNLAAGQPANADWAQRTQIGLDVYAMMSLIQSGNANAGIVAGGDFNDFYFYRPLEAVTGYVLADGTARTGGPRFDNLSLTLPEAERYTYTFDGRSQAIDHIIANGLLSAVATYDVVHLNTGYNANGTGPNANPALSDHDPGVASFDYSNFAEVLNGTSGNDNLNGLGGADTINGGDGHDLINGGDGDDTLTGGAGDDYLFGGVGSDNMTGNTGGDTYYVDSLGDVVTETAGQGFDRIATVIGYTLSAVQDIEVLEVKDLSSTDAIDLQGNELANRVTGNDGVNLLRGEGGADVIEAAGGDDFLVGGSGNDIMGGGAGNDTYFVWEAGDVVYEGAGQGSDRVAASVSWILTSGQEVERLDAVNLTDTAALSLTGNELANAIAGNNGANLLDGKGGNDVLTGAGGADVFAFTTALGGGNVDSITDMVGGSDRIALDNAVFAGLAEGALAAGAFRVGTAAQDADDRVIYNQSTGQLFFDGDGNGAGAAVLFATVTNQPVLAASDFLVI